MNMTEKARKMGMSKTFDVPFLCIFTQRQRALIDKTFGAGYGEIKRGGNEPEPESGKGSDQNPSKKYKIRRLQNGNYEAVR